MVDHHDTPNFRMWESHIHAFVAYAKDDDPQNIAGPLSGLTVGIKDIIDVAGLPTRNGSEACRDARACATDAPVVARLRRAGARIVGKTTTTEFAYTDPTDCRNPHDIARTPGGSSSGSGAAVAAGLVDAALGTQTAGSLCRPAAYCGAVGLKPSYGALPRAGVTPLSPSFDTVGVIARSVDVAASCFMAMARIPERGAGNAPPAGAVACALPETAVSPSDAASSAFRGASKAMASLGYTITETALAVDVGRIVSDHRTVMNYEAAAVHEGLMTGSTLQILRPKFRAALQAGAATSPDEAQDAAHRLAEVKSEFWAGLGDFDCILTLAVPDGAPAIDGTTGFQEWLTPWTVFGGPLVSLPWGLDDLGRPRSVMLAGHPGRDSALLAIARDLEKRSPALPPPTLPVGAQ